MKKFALVLALAAAAFLPLTQRAGAQIVYGTGSQYSYLVIEATAFNSGNPLVYQYYYNPGELTDSYDLFTAVMAADSLLDASLVNYGDTEDPNWFLTSITYDGLTLSNTLVDPYDPFWAQSVSGGTGGYVVQAPYEQGVWSVGDGMSSPYRELAAGSWDGFYYGAYGETPSVSPVPEPSTWILLALGLGTFLIWKRRSPAATASR